MNFLTGAMISFHLWADNNFSGKTCPFPGSLPHGNWTCEMQEIPIYGTSFLDEDAQSYPGIPGYFFNVIMDFLLLPLYCAFPESILQRSSAGWSASQAMLPRRRLSSPVSMGNMQKGVIICRKF